MLSDTSALPTEPVNDLTKTLGSVVKPALRGLESCAQWCNILRVPEWRENVPCGVRSVLRSGVVVLQINWSATMESIPDVVVLLQCSL
jgi:hypothetical protein